MHIQDDSSDTRSWVGGTLAAMRGQDLPRITHACPHCRCPVVYPLIARKSDIELLQRTMDVAAKVMLDYGITGNLLADIRAQCITAIAKKEG